MELDAMELDAPRRRQRGGIQRSICRSFVCWLIDNGHVPVPAGDFEQQKEVAVTELVEAYFSDQRKEYR